MHFLNVFYLTGKKTNKEDTPGCIPLVYIEADRARSKVPSMPRKTRRSANAAAIVCSLTAEKAKHVGEKAKSAVLKYDVPHGQATLGRPKNVKPVVVN